MLLPITAQTITVESAQTTLPAPTIAGDGADITAWGTLPTFAPHRPRCTDIYSGAAGLGTVGAW